MNLKEMYEFGKKNIEEHECLIFIEEFFQKNRTDLILKPNLEIENSSVFFDAIKRRLSGEPLQYILGYWYFDDMKLYLEDGVLIPREDTMCLVYEAAKLILNKSLKGLDLCAGTGAVALATKNHCKNVEIKALELYPIPLKYLEENIKKYGENRVSFEKADVLTDYNNYEKVDFILSNPPYIESWEINELQSEVQKEPHTALDGGTDGLDFYRCIAKNWGKLINQNGFIAFEIGDTQADLVKDILLENGFINVKLVKDLNQLPRVIVANKI